MKKMGIVIISLFFLIAAAGLAYYLVYKPYENGKKIKQKKYVQNLYYDQNYAFGRMYSRYLSFDRLVENKLIEMLAAYEESGAAKDPVSVEDIKEYLASEYTEDGKLVVENKPENIEAYIEWACSDEGDNYIKDYDKWITNYQKDHADKYGDESTEKMSKEMLLELIDEFKNSADKEQYKH